MSPTRRRRSRPQTVLETAVLLALAIALALSLQAYALKPYRIPSGSMEPTLKVGDRVLVNRFGHRVLGGEPHVGDIIVFHPPKGADPSSPVCGARAQGQGSLTPCSRPTPGASSQAFIKRVVAVGGDRIAIRDGHVIRNGRPAREPFAQRCFPGEQQCEFPNTITIPRGSVFLMGDNRGNSDDSRFWGPVPDAWVVGRALAIYWPPVRLGSP
ncbi:signal peptidase I [Baekduia soli]|uniref:Signal peptidase I n=1 Tax=Baekduia soli TaxID=496014 RepID=A0A5B8UAU6_9ACTN|nr:signal peptidase I [Baekduia soli]QEC50329.1 signal peptidase I [Baekduia soli]